MAKKQQPFDSNRLNALQKQAQQFLRYGIRVRKVSGTPTAEEIADLQEKWPLIELDFTADEQLTFSLSNGKVITV